ncbi:MAG: glycine zipper family protein [Bacteroidota bacterium]
MILINPYYSLYEAHWNGLDYVGKKLTKKSTLIDLINKTVEYYLTIDSANCFIVEDNYRKICALVINQQTKTGILDVPDSLTYLQKQFYKEFLSVLNMENELIKQFLVDFEKRILLSELTEREQKYLLIITSVGRSSLDYWNYQLENFSSSPWNIFLDEKLFKFKIPSWLVADATGAAIGALSGAGMGLGGDNGSWAGAAIGALIGGVSASGAELIG